ncbi:phosphate ABC transporter ATP-binding protein [Desulfogranum japonicum]|uniref:phosphate ABC transporter ATP-binding protein n=1 Tax=Desulfogranum japonicum TaxID=231447 RepID=UPI000418B0A7|nr:ATP-binding cassette domain-containing protein [Desulfogranum japonicum]
MGATKNHDNLTVPVIPVNPDVKIQTSSLCFYHRHQQILHDVSVQFPTNTISAITGPSGSGKSTFLTVLNRLWEETQGCRISGTVRINLAGSMTDIYSSSLRAPELRRKVGMVFQQPNPLPMSIFKNIAFPLRLAHNSNKKHIQNKVEASLKQVYLWDEVKDRLQDDGRMLSGGQQQRLCLARALVLQPEILLLDEPTSSLDPEASNAIEELLLSLKKQCTLIMVSHYHDQIQRIADLQYMISEGRFLSQNATIHKESD